MAKNEEAAALEDLAKQVEELTERIDELEAARKTKTKSLANTQSKLKKAQQKANRKIGE